MFFFFFKREDSELKSLAVACVKWQNLTKNFQYLPVSVLGFAQKNLILGICRPILSKKYPSLSKTNIDLQFIIADYMSSIAVSAKGKSSKILFCFEPCLVLANNNLKKSNCTVWDTK